MKMHMLFLKLIGDINFNCHIYQLFTNEHSKPCVLTSCEQLQCIAVVVNSRRDATTVQEQSGIQNVHVHIIAVITGHNSSQLSGKQASV